MSSTGTILAIIAPSCTLEDAAFATEISLRPLKSNYGPDLSLLAYLEALTFDFEREGQTASCVLIYAEPDPDASGLYRPVVAADSGYEGIACVDDTARAALLALGVYERSRSRKALALARRWLSFVEYMQYPDGRFANFIRNAAGIRNATGPTSYIGGLAWTGRALWALARAHRLTGDRAYLERYLACPAPLPAEDGKMAALFALAALELHRAAPSEARRRNILDHCEVLLSLYNGRYFRDQPGSDRVHLWGYHQLHAMAEAAGDLEEPRLLKSCRGTVTSLVEPDVKARIWYSYPDRRKNGVCAYNATPMVQGLSAMHRATGAERYRVLALQAAAWFYGRNDARAPMYDPTTGRCRDGIDNGVPSPNFGAESAIEAGLAELERRALLDQS